MSNYKRLGKNTFLVFIGNIGSKSISFLMLPLYTTWLSVADYGTTDIVTIYTTFLLSIISGCIAESIFIFPNKETYKIQKEYFTTGLYFAFISFIVSFFLFCFAKLGFDYYKVTNSFSEYTWWIFWIIVATFSQNYMQQFSRSIDKIRVYAISGIVLTGCTAIFAFLLVPKYGVKGFFLAQILSLFFGALYIFIFTKSYNYFKVKSINIKRGVEMLRYSIPLIPNGIVWLLVSALNRPILEYYYGLNSVGIFAVASKFPAIIIVVFSIFISAWQISVLDEFKKINYEQFYNKILRIIFLMLIILSCTIAIFSEKIIFLMAHEKFMEASNVLPILTFAVIFSSLSGFVGANFSAVKKSKYYFYSSVFGAVASVIFNWLLIPLYGLYGAAIAIVISYFIMAISRIVYSWQFVKISNLKVYMLMLLINFLVILTVIYIQEYNYLLYILFFIILLFINKKVFEDFKEIYYLIKLNYKKT